jgi:hypothetical protein
MSIVSAAILGKEYVTGTLPIKIAAYGIADALIGLYFVATSGSVAAKSKRH